MFLKLFYRKIIVNLKYNCVIYMVPRMNYGSYSFGFEWGSFLSLE